MHRFGILAPGINDLVGVTAGIRIVCGVISDIVTP